MRPVLLEVVTPMVANMEMGCPSCSLMFEYTGLNGRDRKACAEEYPEDWREALSDLSKWIMELSRLYRHRIRIRMIDAQSPRGMWKQIRHRVRKFPAFIVDSKKTYIGWDSHSLEELIDERIRSGA